MFVATFTDGTLLRKILDANKDLFPIANWNCQETGISWQAMDSAHIALSVVSLNCGGFDVYTCNKDYTIGIQINSIWKILKAAGNSSIVTIKFKEDADTVTMLYDSKTNHKVSEYEMKLLDYDTEHLTVPDSEYSCIIEMSSLEFQKICKDLSQIGDEIKIRCHKEIDGNEATVEFAIEGDIGKGNIKLKPSSESGDGANDMVTLSLEDDLNQSYSLLYLSRFTKGTQLSPRVKISMSSEFPLQIEYLFPEDMGFMQYYIAPQID